MQGFVYTREVYIRLAHQHGSSGVLADDCSVWLKARYISGLVIGLSTARLISNKTMKRRLPLLAIPIIHFGKISMLPSAFRLSDVAQLLMWRFIRNSLRSL